MTSALVDYSRQNTTFLNINRQKPKWQDCRDTFVKIMNNHLGLSLFQQITSY